MKKEAFVESLLQLMERKDHWAWPSFTDGTVKLENLHHHFEQEYETYVRDFPVMIGWSYVKCPFPLARQELAENLYEEETGGLEAGKPHPELFLRYPRGLQMDMSRFETITLYPKAQEFRDALDTYTINGSWEQAAAVTTIFLEGTKFERGELDPNAPKRPSRPLEKHPLVVNYGLPIEDLELTKAHGGVEGDHRTAAWKVMTDFVPPNARASVLQAVEDVLAHWLTYRDEVAEKCGLTLQSPS